MPSLIDTHCHLDDARFDADRSSVVERAVAAGIERIIVPGVHPRAWPALGTLQSAHPCVRIALGVHPHALPVLSETDLVNSLDHLASTVVSLDAIAIGEVGFDGVVQRDHGVSYETQTRVVDAHIEIARALDLPLILHVYRAQEIALRALSRHAPIRGVVHSYSGSAELVRKWVALGLHLSFAGAVTRPGAKRPLEALRAAPLDRLLVETDAPDQAPHGADSERCEPAHALVNARAMAHARGESFELLADATTRNAQALFGPRLG